MPQQDSNRLYQFPEDNQDQRLPVEQSQDFANLSNYADQVAPATFDQRFNAIQPTVDQPQSKYNFVPVDYDPFKLTDPFPVGNFKTGDLGKFIGQNISEEAKNLYQWSRPTQSPMVSSVDNQPVKSLAQIYQEAGPLGKLGMSTAGLPYGLAKNIIYEPLMAAKNLTQKIAEGTFDPTSKEDISESLLAAGIAGTGGLVDTPVGAVGVFGGKLSQTANLDKLAAAQSMAKEGKSALTIFKNTDWFQGADGQWRYEIPDTHAQALQKSMGEINLAETTPTKLDEAIKHDELFKAYPELKDVPVKIIGQDEAPGYNPKGYANPLRSSAYVANNINSKLEIEPTLHIGDMNYVNKGSNRATNVMLHEIQHIIQQKEGFAPGANGFELSRDLYNSSAGEVEARNVQTRQQAEYDFARKTQLEQKYGQELPKIQKPPYAPWQSEDVPRSQQIIDYGNKGPVTSLNDSYQNLLNKQRSLEGMRAAVRDPDTRKIYAGKVGENLDHSDIINNIADPAVKQKFLDDLNNLNDFYNKNGFEVTNPYENVLNKFGFLDDRGKWKSRADMDKQYGVSDSGQLKSKLNMFRSDTQEASQTENALSKLTNPYTTDAYHGTVNFEGNKLNENSNIRGNARFFSTPDVDLAEGFTGKQGPRQYTPGSQILPLKLDTSDYHVYDAKGKYWDQANPKAVREALEQGKKGVTIKNVKEEFGDNQVRPNATIHITFDSGTVRSKFAKFEPSQFGKSGLLLADTSEASQAENALSKLSKPAPTFYSAVENAVNNIKQVKAPAEQWLSTIQNSKGVKPEEMDWIGLKDYLNENKGKMLNKQDIQDYVNANKVQLQEVNKGQFPYEDEYQKLKDKILNNKSSKEEENRYRELHNDRETYAVRQNTSGFGNTYEQSLGNNTKFSQYQLPGGTNYREKLLTLPEKNKSLTDILNQLDQKYGKENWNYNKLTDDEKLLYKNSQQDNPGDQFKSSHWDEPNVLAHVRMNDREIEGQKALHLEEIQSDWLQQGRTKGFKLSDEKYQSKQAELNQQLEDLTNEYNDNPSKERKIELDQKEEELANKFDELAKTRTGVSDAPFKKSWQDLVLKRMIREAAEKGYDKLSWTPGEAQAERYDLSKQVDSIDIKPEGENRHITVNAKSGVHASGTVNKEGKVIQGYDAFRDSVGKPLSDLVGKEMADKLMKTENEFKFQGEGLKIGGEGMKGFYDQIIPKALEKITGQKVKYGLIEGNHDASLNKSFESRQKAEDVLNRGGEIYAVSNSGEHLATSVKELKELEDDGYGPFTSYILGDRQPKQKIPYIDIPQSLKDTAMQKGFPLFSSSGAMLVPVDHNPNDVNNRQIQPIKGSPNPNLSRSQAARQ